MDSLRYTLKLLSVPGLGPRKILSLKNKFGTPEKIYGSSLRELSSVYGIDYRMAKRILESESRDDGEIDRVINFVEKKGIKYFTIFDTAYPKNLLEIYDPPPVLFYMGEYTEKDFDAIAVVGTRNPTVYGKSVTESLVKELIRNDITIISGFARGIDTIAHRIAISMGGRTIAVLGCGIDVVYPPENKTLVTEIITSGLYCTEYPPGTKPDAINFPRRNRIISGLSLGTIVIEAGEKSGALITALYSLDQNREVFAVPGRITDKKSVGTNSLIKKGAKLVTCVEDILEEIDKIRKYPRKPKQLEISFKLDSEERNVYETISGEPTNIDTIAEKLGKQPHEILPTLLSLEIKGVIKQLPGKMFIRC